MSEQPTRLETKWHKVDKPWMCFMEHLVNFFHSHNNCWFSSVVVVLFHGSQTFLSCLWSWGAWIGRTKTSKLCWDVINLMPVGCCQRLAFMAGTLTGAVEDRLWEQLEGILCGLLCNTSLERWIMELPSMYWVMICWWSYTSLLLLLLFVIQLSGG